MLFRFRVLYIAIALVLIGPDTFAAQTRKGTIELDPARTLITFELPGSLHTTHGTFRLERGIIKVDLDSGTAQGLIVVDAASGASGLSARDHRMRDGILEAQKYREIIFAPYHVTGHLTRDGRFQTDLQGVMTLHGEPHQLAIRAEGGIDGDNLVATAQFSIPYVEWGLKDPSLLFLTVAKQVEINISTVGHIAPASLSAPGALVN